MPAPEENLDPVDRLAGEFLDRRRRGEQPTLEEYTARHPELEERIRDVFSALLLIENYGSVEAERTGSEAEVESSVHEEIRELGDYRIIRRIGRGGMGVVYEAEQVSLGRQVALKVLPSRALLSPDYLKRFQIEARAAARLHHPNIVPIHEVGEANGIHYYAMQFIPGQGLDEVLEEIRRLRKSPAPPPVLSFPSEGDRHARSRRVATELLSGRFQLTEKSSGSSGRTSEPAAATDSERTEARRDGSTSSVLLPGQTETASSTEPEAGYFRSVALIGIQVAEALAHAHGAGILHRDIKPSNLLLDLKGTVWVTDFGLAKTEGAEEVTQTGDIVGTLRYMGPERFKGWSDPRSDIYSLGATLYELLTLRPAFAALDRAMLVREILHVDPAPPRRRDPSIPRDLETVVLKAIEKEPQKRYESAQELAEDLKRFLDRRPIVARRISSRERLGLWCRRNPLAASLSLAVASLLVAVSIISGYAALRLTRLTVNLQERQQATVKSLHRAYHEEARSRRLSRRVGQRLETLRVLALAAQIEPGLDLRNQAIAALALVDLNPAHPEWRFTENKRSAFSFDESLERYAWTDEKGGIHIHRVADRSVILTLPGTGRADWHLWFSPDGRRLGVIQGDAFVLWDIESGTQSAIENGCSFGHADFARDGRPLVGIGGRAGVVHIVDLPSGRVVRSMACTGGILDLRLQPGGRLVAVSVGGARSIHLLDTETGAFVRKLSLPSDAFGLAWHPDGKHLAAGDTDSRIHFGDLEDWDHRRTLEGHLSPATTLHYSPTGDILASFGYDKRTILWDPWIGEKILEYEGEPVHFSSDGRFLGFRSLDSAEIREVVRPTGYRRLLRKSSSVDTQKNEGVWNLSLSPGGDFVVLRDQDDVHVLDFASGSDLARLKLPLQAESVLLTAVGGLKLITLTAEEIHTWPVARVRGVGEGERLTLGPPRRLYRLKKRRDAYDRIYGAGLQRGGTKLVFSHSGHPHLLDLERPEDHHAYDGHPGLTSINISPDGRWITGGTWHSGTGIPVWDAAKKERHKVFPAHDSASATFSPDSRWLVTCDGIDYRFYRTGTWEESLVLERYRISEPPGLPFFSPDGRMVVIAPTTSQIRLVDPATGMEFASLEPPFKAETFAMDFSPEGSLLAMGTRWGFLHLWDLRAIRRELQALRLDWDLPPYPEPAAASTKLAGADVLLGELDPATRKGLEALQDFGKAAREIVEVPKGGHPTSGAAPPKETPAPHERAGAPEPADDSKRFARAFLLLEQGKHADAMQVFRDIVAADPTNPDFLNGLAWACLTAPGELRRQEEALGLSLRAVTLIGKIAGRPNGTDLLFLALAKSHLGAPAEARGAYDRALQWRRERGTLAPTEAAVFEAVLREARRVLGIAE